MIVMQRLIKATAPPEGETPRKRWMKRSENNTAGKSTHIVPGGKLENFSKRAWILLVQEFRLLNYITHDLRVQIEKEKYQRPSGVICGCKLGFLLSQMWGWKRLTLELFIATDLLQKHYWAVVSHICYVHPYLGKIPILTNIFQRGWNHQLVNALFCELISLWLMRLLGDCH